MTKTTFPNMVLESTTDFTEAMSRIDELKAQGIRPTMSTNRFGTYIIKY